VHNLLNYYFVAGHSRAFLHAAVMIYRPPLLDILPIYIIFLALTPFAVLVGSRLGWRYAFAGSGIFWLLAQFGFQNVAYLMLTRAFHLQIPLSEMGAFNLWAWQLWWLVGLWLGVRWAKQDLPLESWAKKLTIPALGVVLLFVVLRYLQLVSNLDFGGFAPLFDKWNFGIVRIFDFTAATVLVIRLRSVLKPLAIRPLVMLGQASLPVFCIHLLIVFMALTIMGDKAFITGWQAVALVIASISALMVTANVVTRNRERSRAAQTRRVLPLKVHAPRAT
jgi:hypothetical protein